MHAMILAAGRGERLRPITDELPKALVQIGAKPAIVWHLENLARAGFRHVVINLGHLGEVIRKTLGNGNNWGIHIHYSDEGDHLLETGGGIHKALPLLGHGAFLVINGDIWTGYPLSRLRNLHCEHAHLVMVSNPEHNPSGDFFLNGGRISPRGEEKLTFSGLGVYHPSLFSAQNQGKFPLLSILKPAIDENRVSGEQFFGKWFDIGTLERLNLTRQFLDGQQ